ncbi:class I SAM-dependent methyltransferase [Actinoplanes couchii]|uniref:Methyltransferase n=1 Tax=Actinoplanes couchii TaxID=403638 RepID=A0ABQ3XGW3_9ACTN|nr:class I SAM-dependent methyltransferase [Actinoplanes couchii]MDR6320791.1 SAM-dependent methyltransferase [Actinoplanes couchii]GID57724.1 methyltransferase [Actinoplanes couchii]
MLLDDVRLHASSVVANNAMNRERQLTGVNSYAKEFGFDPLSRIPESGGAWLDLCCGSGRALAQAAQRVSDSRREGETQRDGDVQHQSLATGGSPSQPASPAGREGGARRFVGDVVLVGVDLVDVPVAVEGVTFVAVAVEHWEPGRSFDLITCVHGLHYVGDKLGVLARVLKWLTPTGTFVADLDLASVKVDGDVRGALRAAGVKYDARRRRISCVGPRDLDLSYRYLGADDKAGPNYTGQPAVNSYYEKGLTLPII